MKFNSSTALIITDKTAIKPNMAAAQSNAYLWARQQCSRIIRNAAYILSHHNWLLTIKKTARRHEDVQGAATKRADLEGG